MWYQEGKAYFSKITRSRTLRRYKDIVEKCTSEPCCRRYNLTINCTSPHYLLLYSLSACSGLCQPVQYAITREAYLSTFMWTKWLDDCRGIKEITGEGEALIFQGRHGGGQWMERLSVASVKYTVFLKPLQNNGRKIKPKKTLRKLQFTNKTSYSKHSWDMGLGFQVFFPWPLKLHTW